MQGRALPLIVHIDDREANRYAVRRFLEGSGFDVRQADNGSVGLELITSLNPDIVILDVKLPDISGFEICRRIKGDPDTSSIPVLHMSAHFTDIEARVEGLDSGADAYLTSINPAELVATVRALLRARRAEEAARARAAEWSATFNSVSDPIFLISSEGNVTQSNQSAGKLFESLTADERHWLTEELASFCACSPTDPGRPYKELAAGGKVYRLSFDRVESQSDTPAGCVCVLANISAIKTAEVEIRRINDELIRARDIAVQANRAKSAFLASMSHELRTPLNAILGYTDILHEDLTAGKTEGTLKDLDHISTSARHLLSMVDDVLDLSRIEAGRADLHLDSFAVSTLVEDVVGSIRPLVDRCHNRIQVVTARDPGTIWTDAAKLRQILLNLLSNACKFTASGTITVESDRFVAEGKDQVSFIVSDTGIGIDADKLPRIFEAYRQGDTSVGSQFGGTGLGLAISRRLAEILGGTLTATSTVGQGSRFTLTVLANMEDERRLSQNL